MVSPAAHDDLVAGLSPAGLTSLRSLSASYSLESRLRSIKREGQAPAAPNITRLATPAPPEPPRRGRRRKRRARGGVSQAP
jgi:hypothetical protein